MPRYPKRGCQTPGCPELTDGQHCEAHKREADANYRKFERDPEINKRYGYAWRKIRAAYVAEHPLCEDCERWRSLGYARKGVLVLNARHVSLRDRNEALP